MPDPEWLIKRERGARQIVLQKPEVDIQEKTVR